MCVGRMMITNYKKETFPASVNQIHTNTPMLIRPSLVHALITTTYFKVLSFLSDVVVSLSEM